MGVFDSIQGVAGTPYNKSQYNRDIIDMVMLRKAREFGVRLPTAEPADVWNYFGAYVFPPRAGLNENVMYLDLASLYPNLLRALNASPETIVGTQEELEASEWTEEDCRWGYIDPREVYHLDKGEKWQMYTDGEYKMVYDPHSPEMKWKDEPQYERCYFLKPSVKKGFVTDVIQDLIDLKYQFEGDLYEAVKRVVNSVYGFLGFANSSNSSRLYDWRLAEAVTLSGRKVIQYTAEEALRQVAPHVDCEPYIALGDTDGCGVCIPSSSKEEMMPLVQDAVDYINGEGYEQFMRETFGIEEEHFMDVEVESYATKAFVPSQDPMGPNHEDGVKKRYAQRITWDEGDEVDDLGVTGMEAARSDVADITQTAQEKCLEWLLKLPEDEAKEHIFEYLESTYEAIMGGEMDLELIGKRKGIGNPLEEYGTASRKASPHIRGARWMNQHCGTELDQGSKPRAYYVKKVGGSLPQTYSSHTAEDGGLVDVIAVEEVSNIPDAIEIDYEKHCEKVLEDPMEPILETMMWTWDDVISGSEQTGLAAF